MIAHMRYFNPRSRKGSDDQMGQLVEQADAISIHAPARGATKHPRTQPHITSISIHAPARGATHSNCVNLLTKKYFNPRSRKGSDIGLHRSICTTFLFQSTLPQGERLGEHAPHHISDLFQSTLPQGERQSWITWISWLWDFNPRSRKGSDTRVV